MTNDGDRGALQAFVGMLCVDFPVDPARCSHVADRAPFQSSVPPVARCMGGREGHRQIKLNFHGIGEMIISRDDIRANLPAQGGGR